MAKAQGRVAVRVSSLPHYERRGSYSTYQCGCLDFHLVCLHGRGVPVMVRDLRGRSTNVSLQCLHQPESKALGLSEPIRRRPTRTGDRSTGERRSVPVRGR